MHVYRNKCTYHKGLLNQLYCSTEMKCLSASVMKVGVAHPWLADMNIGFQASVQINKV